ncbi:unnamed protein product [Linum trigynum]|uniref:Protein FAR1-RELATED SEQUENCE n=1 Tax=Linum trigynum TaxID=586398 RepID=A0AAV2CSM0_9ROSI
MEEEEEVVVMEDDDDEVVVIEEEDRGVVMEDEVSQGPVRENSMFGRVYSRKRSKKNVQELELPAVTSTFDDVVEVVESEVVVIHYTDPSITFADVMQIGFQATAAIEESMRTSPTTIPIEETAATEVLTQGDALQSEGELIAAACQRMMENSDDDVLVSERAMTQEEIEFMHSITPESWKTTLKTPAFERSKHHPFDSSVYVLPKTLSTKLDVTALQVVEFVFSTTTKDDHDFIVETPKAKLSRYQILSLKRKSWVHSQEEYLKTEKYIMETLSDTRDDGMIGYRTYMIENGERSDERVVLVDISTRTLVCEFRMFRTFGVLCRHMIKVMRLLGDFGEASMRSVPDHYILKRWTLEARKKEVVDVDGYVGPSASSENDAGKGIAMRYRETTAMLNQLATNMSMTDEKDYNKWMGVLKKLCNEANKALSKTITIEDRRHVPITGLTLKKKSNPRSQGKERYQSTNEKELRRKKRVYKKRMKSVGVVTPDNNTQPDDHISDLDDNIDQCL